MGLPTSEQIGPVPRTHCGEARTAAAYIASRLGDECRPVLEALGLIGYIGHDLRAGHWHKQWREGTINEPVA